MIKSLNELYDKNGIYYWCNSMGEINMPGTPITCSVAPDLLPVPVRKLYDQFQREPYGLCVYTATIEGVFGMALIAIYSREDIRNDVNQGILPDITDGMYHYAVESVGRRLAAEDSAKSDFEVYHGVDTDPDGDELLFFVPLDRILDNSYEPRMDPGGRSVFDTIATHLDCETYGELFTQALDDAAAAVKWFANDTQADMPSGSETEVA